MQAGEWVFAFGSATGAGHIAEGSLCQDYCIVERFENYTIAVVSDGAGSCTHSHIGSERVCGFVRYQFDTHLATQKWVKAGELPEHEEWHTLCKKVLCLVSKDLENFAINEKLEIKSLSCTIIVAVEFQGKLLVTHIGDGRAAWCDRNDEWHAMMKPFHGEEANETVFITSNIWHEGMVDQYIESQVINQEVKAFCLLTDGCERAAFEVNLYDAEKFSYYDPNRPYKEFFYKNVNIHLPHLWSQHKSQEEINEGWRMFLTKGNAALERETDDKTMILGVRLPLILEMTNEEPGTS